MTAAEAIRARLLSLPAVTALVGTRVYNQKLPQNLTQPSILVQRVSSAHGMHARGGVSISRARVQVDAITAEGSGYDHVAAATAIDEAAHGDGDGSALCGWSGSIGSPAVHVLAVIPDQVRESYNADVRRQFHVSRDYFVTYRGAA